MPTRTEAEAHIERLKKAARWVRSQMHARRVSGEHPSHMLSKLMKEADEKYQLESFGVEGWANDTQSGVEYLNFGDPYYPTIVAVTSGSSWRVHFAVGGWGPYAGG